MLALSNIAKHSADLAESVVEADVLPDILMHMAHPDENVGRVATILIREICKHTLEVRKFDRFVVKYSTFQELIKSTETITFCFCLFYF